MEEIWKEIDGYDGFYEVSNKGNVRSWKIRNGKSNKKAHVPHILNSFKDKDGYRKCGLSKSGKTKQYRIARLVGIAFLDDTKEHLQINHIDGNKSNDSINNLEWVTAKENVNHSIEEGLRTHKHMMGARNKNSILCKSDVLDIRNAYRLNIFTHQEIANAYDVSRQHISAIINKKRWPHL